MAWGIPLGRALLGRSHVNMVTSSSSTLFVDPHSPPFSSRPWNRTSNPALTLTASLFPFRHEVRLNILTQLGQQTHPTICSTDVAQIQR